MAVLVFGSPKGGAGKSTSSVILSTCLAQRGAKVCIIDTDESQACIDWKKGSTANVAVVSARTVSALNEEVDKQSEVNDLVVIDLEGAATRLMSQAVMLSDLVLIPMQAGGQDAKRAWDMIEMIEETERALRRPLPYRVFLTRTGEIKSRAQRKLMGEIDQKAVPRLDVQIYQRAAFNEIFISNKSIYEMENNKVNGLPQAIENADRFADEVTEILRGLLAGRAAA